MKVVIAGGTGFIGQKLSHSLMAAGHSVIVLSRSIYKSENSALRYEVWEPAKWQIPMEAIEGSEAIINLAGAGIAEQKWSEKYKRELVDSRIFSTRCLVKACEKVSTKPKTFISASAVGYYGDAQDRLCVEDSPHGQGFLAELCQSWEKEALKAQDLGIRTIVTRLGIVLSPQGGALRKMLPMFKWGLGGRLGNGKQWMSWIHVDDVVRAMDWFLNRDKISGIFNLTAPHPVTNKEFAQILGKALRRPSFLRVPQFLLRAQLGELADVLLTGQKVLPQRCMRYGFQFAYPHLDKALAHLLS